MGIRLQCPNGHKVHVKSFLAGKRGICPQCGAKFDIPSDPRLSSDDGGGEEISTVPSSPAETGRAAEPATQFAAPPRAVAASVGKAPAPGDQRADPATLDLDALAAAGGTRLLGGQAFGPAGERLAARRKTAQAMRTISLVLTVAVTLLACVLLYILLRSG